MTAEELLQELLGRGINLRLQDKRLWCPVSRREIEVDLQVEMAKHRRGLIALLKRTHSEQEKWATTPLGLAKIAMFLDDGRIGVVLKPDIESQPVGERLIRFFEKFEVTW